MKRQIVTIESVVLERNGEFVTELSLSEFASKYQCSVEEYNISQIALNSLYRMRELKYQQSIKTF